MSPRTQITLPSRGLFLRKSSWNSPRGSETALPGHVSDRPSGRLSTVHFARKVRERREIPRSVYTLPGSQWFRRCPSCLHSPVGVVVSLSVAFATPVVPGDTTPWCSGTEVLGLTSPHRCVGLTTTTKDYKCKLFV